MGANGGSTPLSDLYVRPLTDCYGCVVELYIIKICPTLMHHHDGYFNVVMVYYLSHVGYQLTHLLN